MEDSAQHGTTIITWTAPAYQHYHRGKWWFAASALAGAGLVTYSFITANFLFAVLVVMFAIIVVLQSVHQPRTLDVAVTDMGVLLGERFIPHRDLKSFWFVYDPPVKNLYLEFRRGLFPHEVVLMDNQNPLEVRDALKQFLPEDFEHEEPNFELFARIFKL
jgi:hypothetical protein